MADPKDISEIYDKISSNNERIFSAVSDVRKELKADAQEMKRDLVTLFSTAHDDNRDVIKALIASLKESSEELKKHTAEDNIRFEKSNRVTVIALALPSIVGFVFLCLQIWSLLKGMN